MDGDSKKDLTQYRRRKLVFSVLPVLVMVSVFGGFGWFWFVPETRNIYIEARKNQTKDLVRTVWSMAQNYHREVLTGELTEVEARQKLKEEVGVLRFGNEMKDYYWIHDLDEVVISHPYHDTVDLSQYRDPTGKLVVPEMNKVVRAEGDGFVDYYWQWKDDTNRYGRKISYVQLFEPWGWVIGSGFYVDDVIAELETVTKPFFKWTTILALFVVGLLIVFMIRDMRSIELLFKKDKAVRESESRFRNMARNVDVGIAILKENELQFANHKLNEILDISEDEPESRISLLNELERLIHRMSEPLTAPNTQTGVIGLRQWIRTHTGRRKHLTGQLAVESDIDERYLLIREDTELELQQSKLKQLSEIIEVSPLSIVITDVDGYIEYCNPFAEKVTGYSLGELKGRKTNLFKSNRMPQRIYEELWQTISSGKSWRGEMLNVCRDESLVWEDMIVAPLTDDKGQITHYFAVKSDITHRKAIEKELRWAKEKAERGDIFKSAILQNISHEIRTPLNAISGFVHILEDESPRNSCTIEAFEVISENVEILVKIVENLLKAADLEAGNQTPVWDYWNIDELFDEFLSKYREGRLEEIPAGVSIEIEKDENLVEKVVMTDRLKVETLLQCLLDNALQHTPEGCIRIGYRLHEGELDLFVMDPGKGIAEKHHSRIFDTFYQGNDDYVPLRKGIGLGLSLVKKIVETMKGRIRFETEPGQGTRFFISGICRLQ